MGVHTGTRTAGLIGRIPVEDVIQRRHPVWEITSFKTDQCSLALSTYVDNIFSTDTCAEDALAILEDCEQYLGECWSLKIGEDSKSFMCARGCMPAAESTKQ